MRSIFLDESNAKKTMHSRLSLTYSHNRLQRPMYKGLKACEGYSFTLTSPSHFWGQSLTVFFLWQKLLENEVLK